MPAVLQNPQCLPALTLAMVAVLAEGGGGIKREERREGLAVKMEAAEARLLLWNIESLVLF